MRRPALVALLALAALTPAWAQSDDPRDVIYDLAAIEADHETCAFPLTDEQQDVVTQRRDALVTRGDVSETDVSTVTEQVKAALQRQRGEGLCRPDGAEARLYKRRLAALGLL